LERRIHVRPPDAADVVVADVALMMQSAMPSAFSFSLARLLDATATLRVFVLVLTGLGLFNTQRFTSGVGVAVGVRDLGGVVAAAVVVADAVVALPVADGAADVPAPLYPPSLILCATATSNRCQ
jgi:hypothetical protein